MIIAAGPRQRSSLHPRPPEEGGQGKGVGGTGDGETYTVMLNGYHTYKIIDVPADARSFARGPRADPRPHAARAGVVDPDGKPVAGARCYGLSRHVGRR